jgi:hypothetical protein
VATIIPTPNCGGKNKAPTTKDVFMFFSGICEYVILHGKAEFTDVIFCVCVCVTMGYE